MKTKYLLILLLISVATMTIASITYSQTSSTVTKRATTPCTTPCTQADIPFDGTTDHIYHLNGDLNISGNNTGSNSGVVFVEGNLNINGNYCYGAADCQPTTPPASLIGTVFVVKGNVNIAQSVTRVDAVIIAEGKIYTAGASCSQATPVSALQLVINGSFISLSEGSKIEFCRTLSDNSQPAEKVNHQVKYLVILRDLLSDTIQKWSEIEATTPVTSPTSAPTGIPLIAPKPTPIPASNDYKRVFVTSTRYDGALTQGKYDLSLADQKCQDRATGLSNANLGGTWKVWLSDANAEAKGRLTHYNVPYKRLDGQQVADNWADLIDGTLDNPISIDEYGNSVLGSITEDVWTGTKADGSLETQNSIGGNNYCSGWSTTSSTVGGRIGKAGFSNSQWTADSFTSCNRNIRLYCFEQ